MADEAPVTPDLNLKSAEDLLQMDDDALAKAFSFSKPTPEEIDTDNPLKLDPPADEAEATDEAVVEIPLLKKDATPAAEAVAATEAKPETKEEPAKEAAKEAKPIADFQVYDTEGELEVPPDITVTFKANGKVRDKVPLDRVVRLAQMGEFNQEREEQVLAAKQFVAESKGNLEQLQQQVRQYDAWYAQLLADPDFYQRAQAHYAEQQSPEARAQRAESQLAEERSRHQAHNESQQAAAFVQHNLVPRVTKLLEENPSVSFEELMGRYSLLSAPLLVRGQIPLQSLPAVQNLIDVDLAKWAESIHTTRELDKQKVTNQVAAAQTQSQMAKRQLARATQPAPTSGKGAAPKNRSFKSAEDWLNAALPVPTG